MTPIKSAIYLYFKLSSKRRLTLNIVTPSEPSFKIGTGRPVSTAFIQFYERLKMGMISALTRFFRKVPKGKMAKEGRKRGGKAEKEEDAEGSGMSELSLIMVLPPELLEKIFCYLALKDLNNVMLVCKTWNDIGEAPALWSWFKIRKSSQLELKRLQGCQEIVIQNDWNGIGKLFSWTGLCRKILQHPGLKKIVLYNSDTWERMSLGWSDRSLTFDLLTEVFANMEEIEIHKLGTCSTIVQAKGLL